MTAVTHAPQRLSRYRVEGVIGQGPTATVFKAYDPVGERPVVIKSLRREVALRALGPRLLEQARAAARLSHPGIVAIHDIEQSESGSAIVMEFVPGQNLADWLAAAPLPHPATVLQVMDQVLDAVAFAHHAGFRHGALHAGNVLITGTGLVKITDIGMARMSEPATISAAMRGLVAPEVAQGRPLDNGVDVYAAGVLLYRLLTGRDPELGTPDGGPAFPIGVPRAPSTFAEARRSPIFDAIVAKALAREPGDRYPTAEAFRDALRDAATEAPRPVHGAQSVEITHGEAVDGSLGVTLNAGRAMTAGPAPRAHLALVRSDGAPLQAAPRSPDLPRPGRPGSANGPRGASRPPAEIPTLTIAIPGTVLAMPAFDPWADPAAGATSRPAADACAEEGRAATVGAGAGATGAGEGASEGAGEGEGASANAGAGDRVHDLIGQAERGRRAQVASAARAASAVLAAAASASAEDAALIEAEPFEPPSESVFQDDAALLVAAPASPGIPAEALRRVLKILTPHFGARAGTVLKQVAGQATGVAELHALLLAQAGETVDCRQLRKQLKALARLPL